MASRNLKILAMASGTSTDEMKHRLKAGSTSRSANERGKDDEDEESLHSAGRLNRKIQVATKVGEKKVPKEKPEDRPNIQVAREMPKDGFLTKVSAWVSQHPFLKHKRKLFVSPQKDTESQPSKILIAEHTSGKGMCFPTQSSPNLTFEAKSSKEIISGEQNIEHLASSSNITNQEGKSTLSQSSPNLFLEAKSSTDMISGNVEQLAASPKVTNKGISIPSQSSPNPVMGARASMETISGNVEQLAARLKVTNQGISIPSQSSPTPNSFMDAEASMVVISEERNAEHSTPSQNIPERSGNVSGNDQRNKEMRGAPKKKKSGFRRTTTPQPTEKTPMRKDKGKTLVRKLKFPKKRATRKLPVSAWTVEDVGDTTSTPPQGLSPQISDSPLLNDIDTGVEKTPQSINTPTIDPALTEEIPQSNKSPELLCITVPSSEMIDCSSFDDNNDLIIIESVPDLQGEHITNSEPDRDSLINEDNGIQSDLNEPLTDEERAAATNAEERTGNVPENIGHVVSRRTSRPRNADEIPTRKRKRDPSQWQSTIRKKLKNSGQPYCSSRGQDMPERRMRKPCACKRDCVHRITQANREAIFKNFWKIGSHDRQWEFIREWSSSKPTVTKEDEHVNKRSLSRSFFFPVGKAKVRVCKKMFTNTLGICDSWIVSAYAHVNVEKGNVSTPDKRGHHDKRPTKETDEQVKYVKEHVNLFQRMPSHYCRKRTQREYLQHKLSLSKLARLYSEWATSKKLTKSQRVSQTKYKDIVNRNFNLGFYKPKKDACQLCLLVKKNPRKVTEKYKQKYASHIKNKILSRKLKDKDKAEAMKDNKIAVCTFDLQKQLNCPKSESSELYYLNKLTIFNFTCFDHIKRIGTCYLWHEGIGRKGADDISSCILKYIESLVRCGYKDIRFYSDNCAAQNKNRFLFAMYLYASVKFSISITHRYLEPGHTQMEVDSIHGRIESSTSRTDIYDFAGWVKAIEDAKEKLPKYEVNSMKREEFISFKGLVNMQNWENDVQGRKITWTKVKEVCASGAEGNKLKLKYNLDGEEVTLKTTKVGRPVNLETFKPSLARENKIPLSATTLKHLQKMCDKLIIPLSKQSFIKDVIAGVEPDEDGETEPEYETDEEICTGDVIAEELGTISETESENEGEDGDDIEF